MVGAAAFETMAVYTAMPTAVKDLNGLQAYAWAFTGVALAALVATIVGGDLSDRIGPKLPLLGGLGVFVLGVVVCAAAPTMALFVAGRMLQGLGGGAAIVAVYVVVARTYPDELRPQVFSVMAGAWVVPALVGPAIAGAVTDAWGWRAVFLLVVPIVGLAVWAVRPQVNAIDGPPPALVAGEESFVAADRGGRTRMALVMAVGAILVQDGARRGGAVGATEAAIGLIVLFWALRSLLPTGVLRFARGLPAGVAARGLLAGAFFGAEAFVPLMLDDQRGFSVTLSGVALTASALGWFTGSWWQGRPSLTIDRDRLVLVGAVLIVAGLLGMAYAVVAPVPFLVALVAWVVGGLGMGITIPSVNVRVLSLSPKAEQGANSAALQAIDGVGVLICTSLAGAIYAAATSPAGDQASTFITLFLAMTAFAVVAAFAARRLHVGDSAGPASQAAPGAASDGISATADQSSAVTPPPVIG